MSKMIVFIYHHDRILKGRLFGRVDREMCLLWLFFFTCSSMNVFTCEQWLHRNKSEWCWSRWAWMTPNMELSHWGSRFLRNRAKLYYATATLFVQNRFVMYITRCTGTSVLCISIVYVHNANDFINTTATLLCLRKIDKYIYMLCT